MDHPPTDVRAAEWRHESDEAWRPLAIARGTLRTPNGSRAGKRNVSLALTDRGDYLVLRRIASDGERINIRLYLRDSAIVVDVHDASIRIAAFEPWELSATGRIGA